MIMLEEETGELTRRNIQLQLYGDDNNPSGCQRIDQNHAAYVAFYYTLLFLYGDAGWHWGMQLQSVNQKQNRLDQRVFYCFHLYIRPN